MIYLWLVASITLNVMFFTVIYFDSKNRKERIKTGLNNVQVLLGELENDMGRVSEKLKEIEQELRK